MSAAVITGNPELETATVDPSESKTRPRLIFRKGAVTAAPPSCANFTVVSTQISLWMMMPANTLTSLQKTDDFTNETSDWVGFEWYQPALAINHNLDD